MSEWTKEIDADMARAVKWLADHGGSGVLDRYGHVIAGGETAKHIPALTWCRCMFSGKTELHRGRIWTVEAAQTVRDRLGRPRLRPAK